MNLSRIPLMRNQQAIQASQVNQVNQVKQVNKVNQVNQVNQVIYSHPSAKVMLCS